MKKIVGIFLIAMMTTLSVFAQDVKRDRQRMGDPAERTEQMIKELNLNSDQATQFRQLYSEQMERMRADREAMESDRTSRVEDREARKAEMDAWRNDMYEKVRNILDDDQYAKYLDMQKPPMDQPRVKRK